MPPSALPGINAPTAERWPAPLAVWEHAGQSGQFQVRVDLIRGIGRSGALPDVTLAYQTGNQNSIFGAGWSLNLPSFLRGDGRNLPRYRDAGPDADKFSSTEFGEIVPDVRAAGNLEITRFRPRVDTSFVRIERRLDPATGEVHWLTISRDNVKRLYGRTSQARIADPSDRRRTARWLLEEEIDSRGNRLLFEYKREDLAGVADSSLPERHRVNARHVDAQLHPKRIKWGNQRPHESGGWLFELVFDYGEHDDDSPVEHAEWTLRADAFSDYRNGFEIRTRRLCRRALLFHHLPELGDTPSLMRAHEFTYETMPATSLLTTVALRGFRRDGAGAIVSETLPAVNFAYSTELPPGPVREIVLTDGRAAVGAAATLQWHDLDGNGLPGLLSREAGGAMHYRRNLGDGVLGGPQILASRPSLTDTPLPGAQSLEKLFGDGRSCLVDVSESPGFQERMRSGLWSSYMPFPKTPSVPSSAAGTRNLDLDGDGRADLMLAGEFGVRWHRFNGRDGWGAPEDVVASRATQTALADRTGTVLLADMTGDGLTDLVQVRPGNIRYWPNLGYGKFGEPVQMANCPLLDGPDLFDPARVRLFDIDGSGVADLVYLGREAIVCYPNHSGNGFGPVRVIASLPLVTDLDAVGVVDLLGTGTGCLVWSSLSPGRVDRPLCYIELVGGRQPHLLASIDNGQGLSVEVSYTTSTRFMLDDARAGRAWHSTFPSPVSLVSSVRETDLITGAVQVTSCKYRHGYFDETERETRGFAFVERRETQHVAPDPNGSTFGERVPERVTRTWYHTGAHSERAQLVDRLAAEFYSGDPDHPVRPGLSVENEFGVAPRELLRSLRGRPIREEVYGASDGEVEAHPFATVDYGYLLRALQPSSVSARAVVAAFTQETIESTYERDPADPRVSHRMVLEVDPLGNSTRQATIAYARRRSDEPEQRRSLVTIEEQQVINRDDEMDWYRAGVPASVRVFEIGPLPALAPGRLLGVEELRRLLTGPGLIELPFEQSLPPSGPLSRRLISATRTQYWNDERNAPAARGTVGRLALVHEQQRAAFTDGLLITVYGDAASRELLEASGYVHDEGLWWARGPLVTYSAEAFYQPLSERTPLNAEYSVAYDAHGLFVAETRDAVGNFVRAEYDYQALAAARITDPNGATVSTSFDAHGLPAAIAFAGAREEGDSLSAPTITIARDLNAWQRDRSPSALRVSMRVRHGDPTTPWERTVSFLDGRGRELQSKRLAEPASGMSDNRWLVESHTVNTASGVAVRTYAPGFTPDDRFSTESEIRGFPVIRSRIDALGRTSETQHADGALTRTIQTAWRVEGWDANDAVRDSPWLQIRRLTGATAQDTAEADAAENHRDTPSVDHFDPAGRVILQAQNGGAAGRAEMRTSFTITGKLTEVTDARRVLTEQRVYDMLERAVGVQSVASGTTRTFYDAEDKPVHAWGARGQEQRFVHDAGGRLVFREIKSSAGAWRVADRLVWGEQAPAGTAYSRARLYLHYDGVGEIKVPSYDFRGCPLQTERRFRRDLTVTTDWNEIRSVAHAEDAERLSAPLLSGERFITTATYDARDRLLTRTTPDGTVTSLEYNARGLPASIAVTMDGRTTAVLQNPVYDAAGRRLHVLLGNGVREMSVFDEGRGFLKARTTIAPGDSFLRDLSFSHDAVGNVLSVTDAGQQTRYFRNAVVTADRSFRYDSFYRLSEAQGREAAIPNPLPDRLPLHTIPDENDLTAVRRYRENYIYDLAGNITELQHVAGSDGSWTIRCDIDPRADRITALRQADGTTIAGRYDYDDAGNALILGGLNGLVWNDDEQLAQVNLEGGGVAHYTYDATGQRAAKVIARLDGSREERFYLDGFELFRSVARTGNVDEEQTSLHVEDKEGRLLLIERRRVVGDRVWTTLWRYQHTDQVGSSWLETDQEPRVLTFEEFRPYGTTAYHAAQPATLPKRYRFGGKENDAETGLNYHGVRYYSPWLSRWISADPAGMTDSTNRYAFVSNNPMTFADPSGTNQYLVAGQGGLPETHVPSDVHYDYWVTPLGNSRYRATVGIHSSIEEPGAGAILFESMDYTDPSVETATRPNAPQQETHRTNSRRPANPQRPPTPVVLPPVPIQASAPAAEQTLPQVEVRPDTGQTNPAPPAAPQAAARPASEERSFWSMGGRNLVLGALATVGGIAAIAVAAPLIATAGGIALAAAAIGTLAGGLGAAGGFVGMTVGAIQLGTSGSRTAAQDREINEAVDTTQNVASIGGISGVIVSASTGADERQTRTLVEVGAAAEGVINLGQGAFTVTRGGYRLVRAGSRLVQEWREARQVARGVESLDLSPPPAISSLENPQPALTNSLHSALGSPAIPGPVNVAPPSLGGRIWERMRAPFRRNRPAIIEGSWEEEVLRNSFEAQDTTGIVARDLRDRGALRNTNEATLFAHGAVPNANQYTLPGGYVFDPSELGALGVNIDLPTTTGFQLATVSGEDLARILYAQGWRGGTLYLAACQTAMRPPHLGPSVAEALVMELRRLGAPTTVFAPLGEVGALRVGPRIGMIPYVEPAGAAGPLNIGEGWLRFPL